MTREVKLDEGLKIILADVRLINPALDANPDEVLLVSVPFPGIRTTTDKKGNSTSKGDMVLVTISDRKFVGGKWVEGVELFATTDNEFIHRGLLARIPAPIIEPRWSAESVVALLDGKAPAVSPWEVFDVIRSRFDINIDFGVSTYGPSVCAIYTLGSYLFFLFEYWPYLKLGGDKGAGKTKTGNIFAALGHNGLIFSNASKAVIYRSAQDARLLQVIDEGEQLAYKSEEWAGYSQVINSGYQRNGFALLSDKDTLRPTKWSTYCPKVICSINGLEEVLGDRAWEMILLKTLDKTKGDREVSLTSKEWQPIRDQLYLFLFQHWREVIPLIESTTNTFDFTGRIWNLAKPLVVVARLVDKYRPEGAPRVEDEVRAFIQDQVKEKHAQAQESHAANVLVAIEDLFLKGAGQGTLDKAGVGEVRIRVVDVRDSVREAEGLEKLSAKNITTVLKNLGLYKEVRRDGGGGLNRFGMTKAALVTAKNRLGLQTGEGGEGGEGGEDQNDSKHASLSSGGDSGGSKGTSLPSQPSPPSPVDGICEYCGEPGALTKTSEGHFVCAKCLRESQP